MSNNLCPYVGVDVASDFSYYGFVTPDGQDYCEPIKARNDAGGLAFVLKKLKNVEKTLGKPILVIESTGHNKPRGRFLWLIMRQKNKPQEPSPWLMSCFDNDISAQACEPRYLPGG
ncbi:MAG: hypothetical protein HPY90_00190 [Syntrophothermus sp.]|uniref:hypothetical protein n=1 Tax=Syntrophothermus sp. TaxID=2736299 RepID=UPI00257B35F2|nr:hypothetical protein [Syntrophothermus sp.]NSW81682.1 hypothetical protein [Syntrophothermus sp.]